MMLIGAVILISLVTLYLYSTRTFNYWKERGIVFEKPIPIFGNNFRNYACKKSMAQMWAEMYWKYPNEKVVGFFRASKPELIVRDPEIIKRILSTDFYNYHHRGLLTHKTVVEPILRNLFFADGDLWRLLRQRMTPAFTSGKLKAMFPLVCDRAERLQELLAAATKDGTRTLDARDVMARYTTDFIGSVGFGLNTDSLSHENSAFRKLGQDIFAIRIPQVMIFILKQLAPELGKYFRFMYTIEKDLTDLVKEIMKQRNYEPSGRNDFIDLLLELKKKGAVIGESLDKKKEDGSPEMVSVELDDELFAAQVFVFFAAGFETSSSATSFTLHQLAHHPEKQKKVQEDIDRVLEKHGKLCYDAVKDMTYLECAFKEAMRIFPSLGYIARECTKKCTIPELNLTLDPLVGIQIPLQALHMDPQYFDNPEEYRPERFLPDVFDKERLKYVYMPFGAGPRACIGERLGHMQSLAGLAALLSSFSVEPAPETQRHPVVDARSNIVQCVKGGIPLQFRRRCKAS